LRPAAFLCAVVPPCDEEERDDPECEFLPPRLDEPGTFAIRAARLFGIRADTTWAYVFADEAALRRALVAPAGLAILAGPAVRAGRPLSGGRGAGGRDGAASPGASTASVPVRGGPAQARRSVASPPAVVVAELLVPSLPSFLPP